jgi:amidohydrolase
MTAPNLRPEVAEIKDWLVETRRDFHRHPELSGEEQPTQGRIIDVLDSLGIEAEKCGGTGVAALMGGKVQGRTIALRADMDALPVTEAETDLNADYISQNEGVMHACGPDAHMAMVLGAARILTRMEFGGGVKLIFQPAEEKPPGGALRMIDEGVLRDPDVDAIMGFHVIGSYDAGTVQLRKGPLMASTDAFYIDIMGKGGHGAYPHLAVDPIQMASEFVQKAMAMPAREVDPLEPSVVSFGKIAGGAKMNVIPDRVRLEGTVRTLNEGVRDHIRNGLERVLNGVMEANKREDFTPEYKYEYEVGYPVLDNDSEFAGFIEGIAANVAGRENVNGNCPPSMAGEDFAYYLREVPGAYAFLGSRNAEKGILAFNHEPWFDIDEDILPIGVEIYLRAVERFLDS